MDQRDKEADSHQNLYQRNDEDGGQSAFQGIHGHSSIR